MWRDKYELYEEAVQSPMADVKFIEREYLRINKKEAQVLMEDFCGTGALLKAWVQRGTQRQAIGLDLDPEPLRSGLLRHYSTLKSDQKKRVSYIQDNVLRARSHKADVICAFNYSYSIFKDRKTLLQYFKRVKKSLSLEGLFFLDAFGGAEAMVENEEMRVLDNCRYFWECESFNPLTHECFYSIHFQQKNSEKKHRRVFTYDWRYWSLPELKDLLEEAGFRRIFNYWEGDSADGKGGNGVFRKTQKAENCLSWISYVVAQP
jgi:ubiquinone/menaquinone biosynthesis C-methylase UbiE